MEYCSVCEKIIYENEIKCYFCDAPKENDDSNASKTFCENQLMLNFGEKNG